MIHEASTKASPLPRLYTLREAAQAFGTNGITEKSLRREVLAGRVKAYRSRPGRTAKILIAESELLRWLEDEAGARQFVATHRGPLSASRRASSTIRPEDEKQHTEVRNG